MLSGPLFLQADTTGSWRGILGTRFLYPNFVMMNLILTERYSLLVKEGLFVVLFADEENGAEKGSCRSWQDDPVGRDSRWQP